MHPIYTKVQVKTTNVIKAKILPPQTLEFRGASTLHARRQTALDAFWKCFLAWEPHPVIDSFAKKTFASKSLDKLLSVAMSCNEAFPSPSSAKVGIKGNRAALGGLDHDISAEGFRERRGKITSKGKGGFYTEP